MKKSIVFIVILIMAVMFNNCQKAEPDQSADSDVKTHLENLSSRISIKDYADEHFNRTIEYHRTRLSKLGDDATRSSMHNIIVPDDFPTIQEAIDAACDNATIIVKPGVYVEEVFVYKPGLKIIAQSEDCNDVTLYGNFLLDSSPDTEFNADNVKIKNFNIVVEYAMLSGIWAKFVTGGEIKHNCISGDGLWCIMGKNCKDLLIQKNHVSQFIEGIVLSGWGVPGSSCSNNKIINNTITEVAYGIELYRNSANNMINGNNITAYSENYGGAVAIVLWGYEELEPYNNIIKNNQCNYNIPSNIPAFGIWMIGGGSNNTIGPNNICNYNEWGIYLDDGATDNHVFNNTALYNTEWDIYNLGTGNTFKNNKAENTFGF